MLHMALETECLNVLGDGGHNTDGLLLGESWLSRYGRILMPLAMRASSEHIQH